MIDAGWSRKGLADMFETTMIRPLEKMFRFYAVFSLALFLFQLLGMAMYLMNVWPDLRLTGASGGPIAPATATVIGLAVAMGLTRSVVWIAIYWRGASVFHLLRTASELPDLADRVAPGLSVLTRLLIVSCVLDVLFLPAYFASEVFLPFSVAGWRLGAVETARLVFPQVFGIGALVLAYLTHQYAQLLAERGRMKTELELTI